MLPTCQRRDDMAAEPESRRDDPTSTRCKRSAASGGHSKAKQTMQHNNKMKNIKHLLTLLALIAFGTTAWAQEVHVSNESDLRTAIQNQPAGTTIIVDVNFSTGMDELVFNKGFILDLNGKTITANNHFRVTDNWTLQIYDNSTAGTGTIKGRYPQGDGCAIYIDNGSTLEIFSGTIKGDVNSTHDGGVIYNAGTLTMYGGKITNGRALNGGGVYNTGTMTLGLNNNGGSIENCEAFFNGGGIYNTGTLTINRGTIGGFD